MGRLKKDHSGYRSSGLYTKYKSPSVNEKPIQHKSKKNTIKWCKGKIGVEHVAERYFYHFRWTNKRTNWIMTRCIVCRKELNRKDNSIPLRIELDDADGKPYPIQVKVNGLAVPIDYRLHDNKYHWCSGCQEWERY